MTWFVPGRIPTGNYRVWAWIPAGHATAQVEYSMLGNVGVIKTNAAENSYLFTQGNQLGQWVEVGDWFVSKKERRLPLA